MKVGLSDLPSDKATEAPVILSGTETVVDVCTGRGHLHVCTCITREQHQSLCKSSIVQYVHVLQHIFTTSLHTSLLILPSAHFLHTRAHTRTHAHTQTHTHTHTHTHTSVVTIPIASQINRHVYRTRALEDEPTSWVGAFSICVADESDSGCSRNIPPPARANRLTSVRSRTRVYIWLCICKP